MEQRKRRRSSLLPYLLLNIAISAITTLIVLWLWNRAHDNKLAEAYLEQGSLPLATQQAILANESDIPAPLPPTDEEVIRISNIFGMGDLENEVVVLHNVSQQEDIWLNGWRLKDEDGNIFTFHSLVLNRGAQVQVFTRPGHDGVTDLHWNVDQAIWQSGETATLLDYEDNVRAVFVLP